MHQIIMEKIMKELGDRHWRNCEEIWAHNVYKI